MCRQALHIFVPVFLPAYWLVPLFLCLVCLLVHTCLSSSLCDWLSFLCLFLFQSVYFYLSSSLSTCAHLSFFQTVCLCLFLFQSVNLCLSSRLSTCVCLCFFQFVYLCLFVFLPVCLLVPVCLSFLCRFVFLPVCLLMPVCLSSSLSTCACLPVCQHMSVSVSFSLSTCACFSFF